MPLTTWSQVGIGTTTPEAKLDIRSSNQNSPSNTDGILIPKIDEFPTTNPNAGQDGMLVYVTGLGTPTKGFYFWDGALNAWSQVGSTTNAPMALAKVRLSTTQSLSGSGSTLAQFNQVLYDINGNYDSVNSAFNVTESGYYRVTASFASGADLTLSSFSYGIEVFLNTGFVKYKNFDHNGSGRVVRDIQAIVQANPGDTISIQFRHEFNLLVTSSSIFTSFEVERIR